MPICSINFVIFLCIALIIYYLVPVRWKKSVLLFISIAFYGIYNWKLMLILLVYTGLSFGLGGNLEKHHSRKTLIWTVAILILPLVSLKGIGFVSNYFPERGISPFIPLGLSYFSLKVVSYIADIWSGKITAEKDIQKYALFVTFFPEIIVGPIDRADSFLPQIDGDKDFDFELFRKGFLFFLVGYGQKLVIADRVATAANALYKNPDDFYGLMALGGIFFYAIRIYVDFMGCTYIVRGLAMMFGYKIPENFKQPYLADSITECWRRWHISLTAWLRDYVYIPLGGSKKGLIRKCINIIVVFLVSGFWHGEKATFLIWGLLNGMFQVGEMLWRKCLSKKEMYENAEEKPAFVKRIILDAKRLKTFVLMSIAWVFFCAENIETALHVIGNVFRNINLTFLLDRSLMKYELYVEDFLIMLLGIVLIYLVDLLHEQNISISEKILQKSAPVYYLVTYVLFIVIVIFGVYGAEYNVADFIYANF